jgi:hypothetical protein
MSILTLDQIRVRDCIVSYDPLKFDLTQRWVTGPDGVILLCVYALFTPRGALRYARGRGIDLRELRATRIDASSGGGIARAVTRELEQVMFVATSSATAAQVDDTIAVNASVTLINGRVEPLAVTIDQAGAAIRAFQLTGGST